MVCQPGNVDPMPLSADPKQVELRLMPHNTRGRTRKIPEVRFGTRRDPS